MAEAILKPKNTAGGTAFLDLKLYCIAIVMKIIWGYHKNRHVATWNRVEDPAINTHGYGHRIFFTKVSETYIGKSQIFNKWCW